VVPISPWRSNRSRDGPRRSPRFEKEEGAALALYVLRRSGVSRALRWLRLRPLSPREEALKPRRHDAPVAVILGRRGSGKTTLVKAKLQAFPRVIIVDPEHEYPGEVCESLGQLYRLARTTRRFRFVYRPSRGLASKSELESIDCLAQIAYTVGNLLLVIDEADRYARQGKDTLPYVRLLIDEGRHREVGLVAVARRPGRIPKDLIENAGWLYLFHTHGAHSQKYLAGIIGAEAEHLSTLTAGEYLEWNERAGVTRRKIALGPRGVTPLRAPIPLPGGDASADIDQTAKKTQNS